MNSVHHLLYHYTFCTVHSLCIYSSLWVFKLKAINFLKNTCRVQFVMKAHFVVAVGSDFWVAFIWNLWSRTFQLFECLIHCLIASGAVWTVHFMTWPWRPTEHWNAWVILVNERNNRKQVQYRTEYKTVTLGGMLTLSKQEHLLTVHLNMWTRSADRLMSGII